MSTPTIPDAPFNPGKIALEALIAAGDLDAAGKLAVKLTAATPAPAQAAAPTKPDADRLLSYSEMRSMSVGDMTTLQLEEPQVVQRSLEALRASGERHNRASSEG
jgi:hypothetical protein